MATTENEIITVRTLINAPIEKIWKLWTDPMHIIHWNNASDDWHTLKAENDLRVDGRFLSRMEAKDKSFGFDFAGKYTKVDLHNQIEYTIIDGRKVQVTFVSRENQIEMSETFESEEMRTIEMQQAGWQAILDRFKKYVEAE
jgi:uncharacterized protein YndB with AHSA1/START domain